MGTNTRAVVNLNLTHAYARAWKAIQTSHPEVPAVRLAVGPRSAARRCELAHYAASADGIPAELLVSWNVESTFTGEEAMGVLVHEATHAVASVRGLKDTSRGGRYHSQIFAGVAAEMGLCPSPDRTQDIGWDRLSVHAVRTYAPVIKALDAALIDARRGHASE